MSGAHGLTRRQARRRALDVLYEADLRRRPVTETLDRVAADPHAEPLDAFTRQLVLGVAAHHDEVDQLIGELARGWTINRMPIIDRNILRLAVFELLHLEDVPPAVAIDEAVELAKELSTDDSPRYVNGVLSSVLRRSQQGADEAAASPPPHRDEGSAEG